MPNVTTAEPGTVIEKNIRTRVLSKEEATQEKDKYKYDPFELQDRMRAANDPWGNELVAYIYRAEPPVFRGSTEPTYVGKYCSYFSIEDIQKDYGGGRFRILIKDGQSRVADKTVSIGGTARDLTRSLQESDPSRSNGGAPAEPTTATVLSQLTTAATNPAAQAATVEMMKAGNTAAIEMIKANAPHQLSVSEIITLAKQMSPQQKGFLEGPFGPIAITVVTKLMDKLFTDPFENMARMAELAKTLTGGGGSSANDWKTAMVQAAPQLANAVTAGLHELRLGAEATQQQRAALPPAPANVQPNPAPPPTTPPPNNKVVTMAAPGATQPPLPGAEPPTGTTQRMEVPMQFVWQKIFDFLNDASKTGADIGAFLDDLDPAFIPSVKDYTVEQISAFVAANPTIAYVATHPRFRQCLTELLAWANAPETAAAAAPTPEKPA